MDATDTYRELYIAYDQIFNEVVNDKFYEYLVDLGELIIPKMTQLIWNTNDEVDFNPKKYNILCALSFLVKDYIEKRKLTNVASSSSAAAYNAENAAAKKVMQIKNKEALANTIANMLVNGIQTAVPENLVNYSDVKSGLKEISNNGYLKMCHAALTGDYSRIPTSKDRRKRIQSYLSSNFTWVTPEANYGAGSEPIAIPQSSSAAASSSSAARSRRINREKLSSLAATFPEVSPYILSRAEAAPFRSTPSSAASTVASVAAPVAASHPELIPARFTTRNEYVNYAAKILTMLLLKSCEEFYLGFCRPRSTIGSLAKSIGLCGTESARAKFIRTILRNVYTACYTTLHTAASAETGTTDRQVPAIITYTRISKYIKNIIHPCMLNLIGRLMHEHKAKSKTADQCADAIVTMFMSPDDFPVIQLSDFKPDGTYNKRHDSHELECIYGRLLPDALDTVISRLEASGSNNQYTAQEVKTYITGEWYIYLIGRISREDRLSPADEFLSDIYRLLIDDPTYGGAKYKKRRTIKKRRTFRKRRTIRRHK